MKRKLNDYIPVRIELAELDIDSKMRQLSEAKRKAGLSQSNLDLSNYITPASTKVELDDFLDLSNPARMLDHALLRNVGVSTDFMSLLSRNNVAEQVAADLVKRGLKSKRSLTLKNTLPEFAPGEPEKKAI